MNKAFAILFLSVYLFNICGYRLFFSLAENIADKEMIASLNANNYNESELVQIKYALNLPYLHNNITFERYDGKFELNGVQYNYVKRMIKDDTLYLYCIPNNQRTDLRHTKNQLAKQNSSNPSSDKTSLLEKISSFTVYYSGALHFSLGVCQSSIPQNISFNNLTILEGFTTKHLQPPDLFI